MRAKRSGSRARHRRVIKANRVDSLVSAKSSPSSVTCDYLLITVILRCCLYPLIGHIRLLFKRFQEKLLDLGIDAIHELRNDCGFIEHTDQEAGLFAVASCEHFLSHFTRLQHALEGSERV